MASTVFEGATVTVNGRSYIAESVKWYAGDKTILAYAGKPYVRFNGRCTHKGCDHSECENGARMGGTNYRKPA